VGRFNEHRVVQRLHGHQRKSSNYPVVICRVYNCAMLPLLLAVGLILIVISNKE